MPTSRPLLSFDAVRAALLPSFEREGFDLPDLKSVDRYKDQDWGEQVEEDTGPAFRLGRRFFVVPSWSDSECPRGSVPIYMDPGQAFGTGTHETTQLTLEAMEVWMEPRKVVLDLGTGSGILAIAAKLLDARARARVRHRSGGDRRLRARIWIETPPNRSV